MPKMAMRVESSQSAGDSRRQGSLSEPPNPFQFISVDPSSAQGTRRNNQLAHSHLAKRQRLQEAVRRSQSGGKRRTIPGTQPGHSEPLSPLSIDYSKSGSLSRRASIGSHRSDGSPLDTKLYPQAGAMVHGTDGEYAAWDNVHTTYRYQSATARVAEAWSTSEAQCPQCPCDSCVGTIGVGTPARTIRPVLGAIYNQTLESSSQTVLAQTLDTKLNLTFPKYSKPFDVSSRLALFYEKPIIFHGFTVASAVHRDVLSNEPRLSKTQEIIAHHGKLIHLLNELLSDLSDADVELAILAVLLLTLADLEWHHLASDRILPFQPHMASANWINVFGRVMSLDPNRFKEHVNAMYTLVCRRGGLEFLQLPGLSVQVAYQDLIAASRSTQRPRFDCIWRLDDSVLCAIRKLQHPSLGVDSPGYGFRTLIPGHLPPHAIGTLVALSSIDSLMGSCNIPSSLDHSSLVNARNTIQHQMLSLPDWEYLSAAEKQDFPPACYELCRLTAILYSTAVVFGMPPQSGWHLDLAQRIREHLQFATFESWSQHYSPLLIWSLFISGMATYRSPCRKWFECALRNVLQRCSLSTWSATEKVISQFLWSDIACAHGAAVLWDSLNMGENDNDTDKH